MALLVSPLAAQAQNTAASNFDGTGRGVWTQNSPTTCELQISKSASGKPEIKITRWNGAEPSGAGATATASGSIENNVLNYELLEPTRGRVEVRLKNSEMIAATFINTGGRNAGSSASLDLARQK